MAYNRLFLFIENAQKCPNNSISLLKLAVRTLRPITEPLGSFPTLFKRLFPVSTMAHLSIGVVVVVVVVVVVFLPLSSLSATSALSTISVPLYGLCKLYF